MHAFICCAHLFTFSEARQKRHRSDSRLCCMQRALAFVLGTRRAYPGTPRSEHECQWHWPSCLPNALILICCDIRVRAHNSFDADRQQRGGARSLSARFVYVFRGVSEREARPDSECSAHELNVEMRAILFTPQTFLVLLQRNPNFASPNELLLTSGRYRA